MKLPRGLSGDKLAKALCRYWEYRIVHQTGSHLILETESPNHQRLAIPMHKALRIGTLHSILRSVARHKGVDRSEILEGN